MDSLGQVVCCSMPHVLLPRQAFARHKYLNCMSRSKSIIHDTRIGCEHMKAVRTGLSGNTGDEQTRVEKRTTRVETNTEEDYNAVTIHPQASCYGCGVRLQLDDPNSSGYVEREKYAVKAQHRQFDQLLCTRCQSLSHGQMIPGVEDFAQTVKYRDAHGRVEEQDTFNDASVLDAPGLPDRKRLATPDQLRVELERMRDSRALIVLLIDLLDLSGTLLSRVRDLVGKNPIVVVGTKMDLLPKQVDTEERFFDWFEDALAFKKIAVVDIHLVSSRTKAGIENAAASIKKLRLGRDVYIMGAANVGKSAFVRAFVNEMSSMRSRQYDPLASTKSKRLPVESSMPGTTLSSIPLEVFATGGTLYDTPGLHLHHRIPHILTPEENKYLHPRKRLTAHVPPAPHEVLAPTSADGMHACYAWGGLVRVHILQCPVHTRLTFFGPSILRVTAMGFETKSLQDLGEQRADQGGFGWDSAMARGGLRIVRKADVQVPFNHVEGECKSIADIAISGIPGWVNLSVLSGSKPSKVRIVIEAPVGIEAFIRPPVPLK